MSVFSSRFTVSIRGRTSGFSFSGSACRLTTAHAVTMWTRRCSCCQSTLVSATVACACCRLPSSAWNWAELTLSPAVDSVKMVVGLIDGEHAAVEAVLQVDLGVGQQRDELLALVLHAREGDGDLVVVQVLRQNGQQTRLHHQRHHLAVLEGRARERQSLLVPQKKRDHRRQCLEPAHLLHGGPLAEHQRHGDALQGGLGVEVEEQQLAQRLGRADLLRRSVELRVADAPTQSAQQSVQRRQSQSKYLRGSNKRPSKPGPMTF
ncbi:hypothetical protein EYF80_052236 [Liparis tanakae]|uniref:Uncharacterized protein n=1 Tax=Liparis tanakae TaxID=230148 RepID=A0A4Z2F9G7_9TELE|nr:hypothetical protein EYF80_052236 [Liparis tanakae]